MAKVKGVFKRKGSGKYWLRYADSNGKIVRESSGTTDYKEALKELSKGRAAVAEGKEAEKKKSRKVFLKNVMPEYLRFVQNQGAYKNKAYMAKEFLARFGNIPLQRFSVSMLEAYQQELLADGKGPATVNRKMAMLKHLVRKANDWKFVDDGTLRTIRKVKQLKEPPGRERYLTAEEAHGLLDACSPSMRSIVKMGMNTGMRQGEILSLKWDDVDLRNGSLLVQKSKNGTRRLVPINEAVREVLAVRRLDSPHVFCDTKGKPMKYNRWEFGRACLKAGIVDFHFHDLRHTAASFMVQGGINLLEVGKILGHKTFAMTMRYAHLAPGHLQSAVAAIDRAMNQTSGLLAQFSGTVPEITIPAGNTADVTI